MFPTIRRCHVVLVEDEEVDWGKAIFGAFRRINILEYKNPHDSLNEWMLRKACGYANLYIGRRASHRGAGQEEDDVVREHYRVLLRLVIEKNPRFFEALRKDQIMEDVLMEIVKDRVDERINTAVDTERQQTTVTHIRNIMESFGVTIEKAMDSLKIPPSQRSTYAGLVAKKVR